MRYKISVGCRMQYVGAQFGVRIHMYKDLNGFLTDRNVFRFFDQCTVYCTTCDVFFGFFRLWDLGNVKAFEKPFEIYD